RNRSAQVSQAGTQEINRLQLERNAMADQLKKLNDDYARVTKDLADTTSRETYNRLRADALEKDLVALREEHGTLRKRYEEMRAQWRAGNGGAQQNPPRVASIETSGQVTGVVAGNLAQISLGSDNGLEQGHILQVFRLGKNPNDATYLGTLTITRTTPH